MRKKKTLLILGIIPIVLISIFIYNKKTTSETEDINIDISIQDKEIDWSSYQEKNYNLTDSITIKEGGIYNLTGKIEDGLITINTKDNVKLVLNNISIKNTKGPSIYIKKAQNTVIELKEDTTNYLEDSSSYSNFDEDEIGVIFSKDDIIFEGTGTLEVVSNKEDAIVSKDGLKIKSGTYNITSKDDGIRGKDYVYIENGTFNINSEGDGIKSSLENKGLVYIKDGTFNITSSLDGISSEDKLLIENGTFNIKTGGGSNTKENKSNFSNNIKESTKGIKAGNNLVIENGTFNLDTLDDSIHSNNTIRVKDGTLNLSTSDDAIHADTKLIIDSGTINITKSYEGLEASIITINNGNINIISSDDGINVAGGVDSSSQDGPKTNTNSNSKNILTINNGNIYVNASGDGIDINGSGYIYGGNIVVDGPEDNGNGALDYDNILEVNGGTLVAGGSSGMLQSVSSSSSQYNVTIIFDTNYNSTDTISIEDSSSNKIISYTSKKKYNSLVISSPDF